MSVRLQACYEIMGRRLRLVCLRMNNQFHFTLCDGCDYIHWGFGDHRHAQLVNNEWRTPAKLVRCVTSAPQMYSGCATTCQLTRCSHAGQLNKFCASSKLFWWPSVWEHVMMCYNVTQTCTAFTKHMGIMRRPCRACDKILPHAGHTLMPHIWVWLRHKYFC